MLRLVLSRRTEGHCGLHAMQWRAAPSRLASLITSTAAVITNLLALFHLSLRGADGCGDVRETGERAEGASCTCKRNAEAGLLNATALQARFVDASMALRTLQCHESVPGAGIEPA